MTHAQPEMGSHDTETDLSRLEASWTGRVTSMGVFTQADFCDGRVKIVMRRHQIEHDAQLRAHKYGLVHCWYGIKIWMW